MAKARTSLFAAALDEQIPPGAVVFEAGCGTGQMTNFLGLSRRRQVFGGDMCLNSLRLADVFRRQCNIANAAFLQLNLFRPPFREGTLDVVIANGVLHHTGEPRAGFDALLRTVKPGGVIVIGLYNRLARLPTLWRRWAFDRFGRGAHFLDRRLQARRQNEARWQAWFRDQYRHPHESRHSIGEVLRWFDASGVEFLTGIPAPDGSPFTPRTKLFEGHRRGTKSSQIATQLQMLLDGGSEGGFFMMIGRKHA
jgi:SAM-dependent methyltransferase